MKIIYHIYIYIHIYTPRAPTASIFEGNPPQNKAFSNQDKGHLGSRIYIYIYIYKTQETPDTKLLAWQNT